MLSDCGVLPRVIMNFASVLSTPRVHNDMLRSNLEHKQGPTRAGEIL